MHFILDALSDADSASEVAKYIDPFSGETAIAVLSVIFKLPIEMIDLGPKDFSKLFPKNHIPSIASNYFGHDLKRYRSWRRLMLDMMLLYHRTVVDQDPRDSLIRACRLLHGKTKAYRLYQPESRISFDDFIRLDHQAALEIDRKLSKPDRANFRAAITMLDTIRNDALIVSLGFLGPTPIGPLPKPSAHLTHNPFMPKLTKLYAEATPAVRAGLPFVWRLACLSGVFQPDSDIEPAVLTEAETINKLLKLDPAMYNFASPTKQRYDRYVGEICNYIEPGSSMRAKAARNPANAKWTQLFAAVNKFVGSRAVIAMREANRVSLPHSLCPTDLNPNWFQNKVQTLSGRELIVFRQACYAFDECRGVHPTLDALLPKLPTGILRMQNRAGFGKMKAHSVSTSTRNPPLRS